MVRADGDAELALDEGVVDQVSYVFERLPIVFTDTVTKLPLEPQARTKMINSSIYQPLGISHLL